ncbi:MAG: hypothetical protein E4H23_08195 [Chrysiogenales bacterium]|nr:hypothetical protein [Candidatus Aminicenantes bacterium]TFG78018.1 MAG: hypothetical protein E4H23_08195 [Chrysiogenales bacterium]
MQETIFQHNQYLVRRKVFTIAGAKFHVFDPAGNLVFFSKMKAFKLREDIRLYHDESMNRELLLIKARQIIDFSAAYDVFDAATREKVGVFKRKGLKSILRDEWFIMDAGDHEIGVIREDSLLKSLLRRFLTNLIPQTYHAEIQGTTVCIYKQNFNPFVLKLNVDFSMDTRSLFDRRLGIAGAILLGAIEGRQN